MLQQVAQLSSIASQCSVGERTTAPADHIMRMIICRTLIARGQMSGNSQVGVLSMYFMFPAVVVPSRSADSIENVSLRKVRTLRRGLVAKVKVVWAA